MRSRSTAGRASVEASPTYLLLFNVRHRECHSKGTRPSPDEHQTSWIRSAYFVSSFIGKDICPAALLIAIFRCMDDAPLHGIALVPEAGKDDAGNHVRAAWTATLSSRSTFSSRTKRRLGFALERLPDGPPEDALLSPPVPLRSQGSRQRNNPGRESHLSNT